MNKLEKCLIGTLLVLNCAAVAQAADTGSSLEVDLKHYRFDYKEDLTPPKKSTEKAWEDGIKVQYETKSADNQYSYRALYEKTNGHTNYDGSTYDSHTGAYTGAYTGRSDFNAQTMEVTVGKIDGNNTYYIGYGFRSWDRDILGSATVSESFEKYSWSYVPVGIRVVNKIDKKWTSTTDASFRFMVDGKMKTDGMTFNLANKVGFKLENPLSYKIDSQWSLVLTPWYEYSAIGESNVVSSYVEPTSRTHQYGLDMGIKFNF